MIDRRNFLRVIVVGTGAAALAASGIERIATQKPDSPEAPEVPPTPEELGSSHLPAEIGRVDLFPSLDQQAQLDAFDIDAARQQIIDSLSALFNRVKNEPDRDALISAELANHPELTSSLILLLLTEMGTHGEFTTNITEFTLRCFSEQTPLGGQSAHLELSNLVDRNTAALEYYEDIETRGLHLSISIDHSQITQFCTDHPEIKILNCSFEVGRYAIEVKLDRKQTRREVEESLFSYATTIGGNDLFIQNNPDGTAPVFTVVGNNTGSVLKDHAGNVIPTFTEQEMVARVDPLFAELEYRPLQSARTRVIEPYATDRSELSSLGRTVPDVLIITAGGNFSSFSEYNQPSPNVIVTQPLYTAKYYGTLRTGINGYADVYIPLDSLVKLSGLNPSLATTELPELDSSSAVTALISGLILKVKKSHPEFNAAETKSYFLEHYCKVEEHTTYRGAPTTQYGLVAEKLKMKVLDIDLIKRDFAPNPVATPVRRVSRKSLFASTRNVFNTFF